jgi:hypothetical protein
MADLPEEMRTALTVPATFVNNVLVQRLGTTLVRLTFAEAPVPGAVKFRTALVMTTEDARRFLGVLQKALDLDIQPQRSGPRPN